MRNSFTSQLKVYPSTACNHITITCTRLSLTPPTPNTDLGNQNSISKLSTSLFIPRGLNDAATERVVVTPGNA